MPLVVSLALIITLFQTKNKILRTLRMLDQCCQLTQSITLNIIFAYECMWLRPCMHLSTPFNNDNFIYTKDMKIIRKRTLTNIFHEKSSTKSRDSSNCINIGEHKLDIFMSRPSLWHRFPTIIVNLLQRCRIGGVPCKNRA